MRHGEGFHNIGIVNEDAHLTEAGWRQAEALNKHIAGLKPAIDVQVRRSLCVFFFCIDHALRFPALLAKLLDSWITRGLAPSFELSDTWGTLCYADRTEKLCMLSYYVTRCV